jgi:circadian clock protein KaiB
VFIAYRELSFMPEEQIKDSIDRFEEALKNAEGIYILRLYVTGITPNSLKAIENIRTICRDHLQGRFELEVIDIYKRPDLAREAGIIAAPTLIKKLPLPLRRFIGDLSDAEKILAGLDLVLKNKQTEKKDQQPE